MDAAPETDTGTSNGNAPNAGDESPSAEPSTDSAARGSAAVHGPLGRLAFVPIDVPHANRVGGSHGAARNRARLGGSVFTD